ncbi:MAG: YesL family protein [bacterium]|nr:YesL family protein [bacterium]
MSELFNVNNGFFRTIGKIVDCIYVSILWLVCCIPVVTIGASTTALYYTVHKSIVEDNGYIFRDFKHSFCSNFKQSTIAWLILLVVGGVLGGDTFLTYQFKKTGDKAGNVFYLILLLLVILFITVTYIFPYISRFEDNMKTVFKNAIFMGFGNILLTLLMIITFAVAVYLVYVAPPLIVIVPALYMLGIEQLMERAFKKYIPQQEA